MVEEIKLRTNQDHYNDITVEEIVLTASERHPESIAISAVNKAGNEVIIDVTIEELIKVVSLFI